MKQIIFTLFILIFIVQCTPKESGSTIDNVKSKENQTLTENANVEEEVKALSREKWQWMANKNVEELAKLFDDKSKFVHMSGTWKKNRELEIIETGSIWYKEATIHDVAVEVFGTTVILWNRITLVAHVRGNDVSNEFTVTEIYQKDKEEWKLLDLTFSKARDTHEIEH